MEEKITPIPVTRRMFWKAATTAEKEVLGLGLLTSDPKENEIYDAVHKVLHAAAKNLFNDYWDKEEDETWTK